MLISATAAPKCSKAVKLHTHQLISVLLLQLSLKLSPFWLTAASFIIIIIIIIQLFSPLHPTYKLTNIVQKSWTIHHKAGKHYTGKVDKFICCWMFQCKVYLPRRATPVI